mgnify:CR=1 FL=1
MKKKNIRETKEKILDALEGKSEMEKTIREIINNLKKGETLNYWYDIGDRFDKIGKDGDTDYEIVEQYENILDKLEGEGIIKFKKDEDGNDNIIVKK